MFLFAQSRFAGLKGNILATIEDKFTKKLTGLLIGLSYMTKEVGPVSATVQSYSVITSTMITVNSQKAPAL